MAGLRFELIQYIHTLRTDKHFQTKNRPRIVDAVPRLEDVETSFYIYLILNPKKELLGNDLDAPRGS